MNIHYAKRTVTLVLFAALAALLLMTGCAKKQLPTAPAPTAETVQSLRLSAERAMRQEDYKRAETLYRNLLDQPDLPRDVKVQAWRAIAESAAKLGHYRTALEALETLASLEPAVQDDWAWHEQYIGVLRELGRDEQIAFHLKTVAPDPARSPEVRYNAGISLARLLWRNGEYDRAVLTLEGVYELFPEQRDKARFEEALATDLKEVSPGVFESLTALVTPENEIRFPFSIIRLEQARRLAEDPETWPAAWRILTRMSESGEYAGRNLAAEMLDKLTAERGRPGGGIALVLPLTGPYAEIGWKIASGAGAAQWEMIMSGAQPDIKLLNSEAPDLIERIRSLSPDYAVVGGPLRSDVYGKIDAAGLTSAKPFFAFMSGLPEGQEGASAWRFFSSPDDQINALMDLVVNKLDIRRLGLLYPEEPFGRRMSELFRKNVVERSMIGIDAVDVTAEPETIWSSPEDKHGLLPLGISAQAAYPPGEPTEWGKSVAGMLDVKRRQPEGAEAPLPPEPQFEAVFLPDGWANAELMIPHFYFYEEDRLVFLGPSLWGQGLEKDQDIEMRYYRLAVFPGAFWAGGDSPGTQKLIDALNRSDLEHPDFWVALGYDFVRFAQRLGEMPPIFDPEAVNELLGPASQMNWSMAPISWNEAGIASQDLFLFSPSGSGDSHMEPADPDALYRRMIRVRESHEQRVMKLIKKREMEKMQENMKPGDGEAEPPVEQPLSQEDKEVQNRLNTILDSLEKRESSE